MAKTENPQDHIQPSFFPEAENVFKAVDKATKRFIPHGKTIYAEEARHSRNELRKIIGLPIARRGHFYKYLVFHLYKQDVSNVFLEYDRVLGGVPPELENKIGEIRGFLKGILEVQLPEPDKKDMFRNFIRTHKEDWNIDAYHIMML